MNEKAQMILCPKCQVAVSPFAPYPNLTINICQRCSQVWLDKGESALLLRRPEDLPPVAQPDLALSEALPCPVCGTSTLAPWRAADIGLWRCSTCLGMLMPLAQVQRLKALFPQVQRSKTQAVPRTVSPLDDSRTLCTPWFDLVAIPLVLCVGWVVASLPGLLVFIWPLATFFHEIGHALAAWLGGFFAIPTPFAFTTIGSERRGLVIAFFLAVWLWGLIQSFNLRSRILMFGFAVLLLTQIKLSFFTSSDEARQIAIAAGIGLELVYGGLFIGAFHYHLPRSLRWDFWRFLALFLGALIYSHTTLLWVKIRFGLAQIPWGSAVGTTNDGDLNKLLRQWQWTEADIIERFSGLALLSLVWILGHYIVSLPSMIRRIRSAQSQRKN